MHRVSQQGLRGLMRPGSRARSPPRGVREIPDSSELSLLSNPVLQHRVTLTRNGDNFPKSSPGV